MSFSETEQPASSRDSNPNVDAALIGRVPDVPPHSAVPEDLDPFSLPDPFANSEPPTHSAFAEESTAPITPVAAAWPAAPMANSEPSSRSEVFTPAPLPVYSLSALYAEIGSYDSEPSEPTPIPAAAEGTAADQPAADQPVASDAAEASVVDFESAAAAIESAQPQFAFAPAATLEPQPAASEPAPMQPVVDIAPPPQPSFEVPAALSTQPASASEAGPSPGSNVFERYQKLFSAAESARDHESAILAAVDSAILGAPATSADTALGADASALAGAEHFAPAESAQRPYRARMVSFDLERDIDWNEEAANSSRARAETGSEARQASSGALSSDAPVALDASPARSARPSAAISKKKAEPAARKNEGLGWSAFMGGLGCALVVGFSLGFVMGRGQGTATAARDATRPTEARVSAATPAPEAPEARAELPKAAPRPLDESAPAAPLAEPLLPPPEPLAQAVPVATAPTVLPSAAAPVAQPSPAAPPTGLPSSASSAPAKLPNMEFDSKSALAALGKAASRAGVCVPAGEPGGSVVATVTFGTNGRASNATVSGAHFSGSYSSECIRNILSEVKVRPFLGEAVTVRKTLTIK